jgi:hypothetical protein
MQLQNNMTEARIVINALEETATGREHGPGASSWGWHRLDLRLTDSATKYHLAARNYGKQQHV